MVLTIYFVLSPVIGLSCHRRLANGGKSAPGRADLASARLDAGVEASGPHGFAVRGSNALVFVWLDPEITPCCKSHFAEGVENSEGRWRSFRVET